MKRAERLRKREAKMAVVGLGYVGLPLAVAFGKHADVIAYDINSLVIESCKNGIDTTKELGDDAVESCGLDFTDDPARLREAEFIAVAVPTPVHRDGRPNLEPLKEASRIIGQNLHRGAIISFESTVYPGVTEDICLPVISKESQLIPGRDFFVGYSPERVNPGDKVNTLEAVVKLVAAREQETLMELLEIYEMVCKAGVCPVNSIRAAEAAKLAENTQRDVNIAFMNELAVMLDAMGIDTGEVLRAMNTKWNAPGFVPGLVGGHCIGVDPYYLIHKGDELGLPSNLIRVGREINDAMAAYVVKRLIDKLHEKGKKLTGAKVVVLGTTFKENCPDIRNSKAAEVARMLVDFGADVRVVDPVANSAQTANAFGYTLSGLEAVVGCDAVIIAVAHREYREMDIAHFSDLCPGAVIMDVKGIMDAGKAKQLGLSYWRL